MSFLIYRGNRLTRGAFRLRNELRNVGFNIKVNHRGSFRPSSRTTVLNWGASSFPHARVRAIINNPSSVSRAVCKLTTLSMLRDAGVSVVPFTSDRSEAESMLQNGKVMCRTLTRASGGNGIVVARCVDDMVGAPLYTKYVPKRHEYRVHVLKGKAVCVQQKRRRNGASSGGNTSLIRNAANGWVYAVNNVVFVNDDVRASVIAEACRAVAALHLDVGAVDILVGRDDNRAYVLEVNTAPGLESPTVIEAYVKEMVRWFQLPAN